ncbi:uncharacterized protein B0P05DRAFT_128897 [Gilbertella persicaria]|uniref:uncharacterized protein n=1 Tax=Gilbertella persicaria TaxID=101096 RepID=UPI002220C003|nr:uncharacterized protein B0P05DRAFT_128897 [Gilbertella persicaria]KAI8077354.1 hypothetical protein B0P05DRAFT_128897 [Gilbertella persicaria]
MKGKVLALYLIRFVILLLSLGTLGCHVGTRKCILIYCLLTFFIAYKSAQLVLLSQTKGTENWWPHYVPYTLYYVGSIVSIISSTFLLIFGCTLSKSLLSDRILSLINLALYVAVVVYNSLASGNIPWTGSLAKPISSDMKGYVNYCSGYTDSSLYNRCWLVNGTWLGMVIVGFFWLILLLYTSVLKNAEIYHEDYDTYDFKEDVPMTNTSHHASFMARSSIPSVVPVPPRHRYDNTFMVSPTVPLPVSSSNQENYYYSPYAPTHPQENGAFVEGYQRPRKMSKTYLEEDNIVRSGSVQLTPPHSKE